LFARHEYDADGMLCSEYAVARITRILSRSFLESVV